MAWLRFVYRHGPPLSAILEGLMYIWLILAVLFAFLTAMTALLAKARPEHSAAFADELPPHATQLA